MIYHSKGTPVTPLNGKNLVILGDSISDKNYYGKTWIPLFEKLTAPKSIRNYARSWCRWTFWPTTTEDTTHTGLSNTADNVVWNQLNRLKKDIAAGSAVEPDVVLIFAGANDAMQDITWGSIKETFTADSLGTDVTKLTTFCQSVRFVCDEIYAAYPDAKVIIVTTTRMSSYPEQALTAEQYLLDCAKEMGIPTIQPAENLGIAWYREAQEKRYYTEDGIHPTKEGGVLLGHFMAQEVTRLLC